MNTIYFVLDDPPEALLKLTEGDNAPFPEELAPHLPTDFLLQRGGHWCLVVQTFLHLKRMGLDVELVDRPVPEAICVTHSDIIHNQVWAPDSFVVGIRADRPPLHVRDIEVAITPVLLGRSEVFLVQHWPQPGLLRRDETRGDRIETLSFFGATLNLSPIFRDAAFVQALADLGVTLNVHCQPQKWHDFRTTDLVLAVRNDLHPLFLKTKPALKLVNAWQAGCVALLGNEPAYRAAGNPGKDYFEVSSPQEVLETVRQLKANPSLYRQVRQAGMARYSEYSTEAVQRQWANLLTGEVAAAFEQWRVGRSPTARRLRRTRQAVHQWVDRKRFWAQVRLSQRLGQTR